ncbi:hypothetical protein BASA81_015217 [Batrachochytrium salamandrivorans]|nr:hypothetical protein BASA81_015217 [Batrachochytrium salamandrivorans]
MATLSTQATSEALHSSMSALKLVCKVLQMRIERFVETNNLLSYEQAGFRKREECVGQVVSLVDIIQRRQNAGLNTHVLFIDIRKAFDTVPVGALLWKLAEHGDSLVVLLPFSRHCTHPHLLEHGQDHYYRTHSQYRGVSDRDVHCLDCCSIYSSTTFSMVSHPSQSLDYRETPIPIRGLMYADDVAVFADSEQSLVGCVDCYRAMGQSVVNAVWCGQVWHHQLHWPSSTTT